MATFKIGDTVMLRGGTQKSTVTRVADKNGIPHVWHDWHNKDGEIKAACHPAEALMLAADKKPPVVNRGPPGGRLAAARRERRGV